jgi:hypothetical protein
MCHKEMGPGTVLLLLSRFVSAVFPINVSLEHWPVNRQMDLFDMHYLRRILSICCMRFLNKCHAGRSRRHYDTYMAGIDNAIIVVMLPDPAS